MNRERYLLDYSLQSCSNVDEELSPNIAPSPSTQTARGTFLLMPSVDGKHFDAPPSEYEASVAVAAVLAPASVRLCQGSFAQFARVTPRQTE